MKAQPPKRIDRSSVIQLGTAVVIGTAALASGGSLVPRFPEAFSLAPGRPVNSEVELLEFARASR